MKLAGLTLARSALLPVGREGPFVQMAAACGEVVLNRVPFLSHILSYPPAYYRVMLAACSAGVAVCFAAPIGGVLFAAEVIGTYFQGDTDTWTCFLASGVGAVVFDLLNGATGRRVSSPIPEVTRAVFLSRTTT